MIEHPLLLFCFNEIPRMAEAQTSYFYIFGLV
ncbi:Uncharacterised protein [Mycobacteroides abscessus subsp. abscessus]|nr:Uncharacterised protein [Mycobacteroides abscessus subsp. abscessus]